MCNRTAPLAQAVGHAAVGADFDRVGLTVAKAGEVEIAVAIKVRLSDSHLSEIVSTVDLVGYHPSGLVVVGSPVKFNARCGLVDCVKSGRNCAGDLGGEGHIVALQAVAITTAVGFHNHSVFGLAAKSSKGV